MVSLALSLTHTLSLTPISLSNPLVLQFSRGNLSNDTMVSAGEVAVGLEFAPYYPGQVQAAVYRTLRPTYNEAVAVAKEAMSQ
ncbi:hypothetical protein KIPB_016856, partial [Kipferlia bialata]|eukprot:g16856.t1